MGHKQIRGTTERIKTYKSMPIAKCVGITPTPPPVARAGGKLFKDGKGGGHITSAVKSPATQATVALGYVRREANAAGTKLTLASTDTSNVAEIVG